MGAASAYGAAMTTGARGIAAALLAVVLGPVGPAAAHDGLVDGSPTPDGEVGAGLTLLQMQFTGIGEGDTAPYISLEDVDGATVPIGEVQVVQDFFLCARSAALTPGVYTLEYAVPGADGHLQQGRYDFTVASGAEPAPDGPCTGVALDEPREASPSEDSGAGPLIWVLGGGVLLTALVVALAAARQRRTADAA